MEEAERQGAAFSLSSRAGVATAKVAPPSMAFACQCIREKDRKGMSRATFLLSNYQVPCLTILSRLLAHHLVLFPTPSVGRQRQTLQRTHRIPGRLRFKICETVSLRTLMAKTRSVELQSTRA